MIAIFDYGAGNLRSVANTLEEIGAPHTVVNDAEGIRRGEKIILPGVGHFGQMMRALDRLGVRDAFCRQIQADVPFLGICLGLHALFRASEEAPEWNTLERRGECRLLRGLDGKPYVYFAHSYYAPVMKATAATCTYGAPYTALLEYGNIFGVQFHPEKSGPVGLRIMKNFVEL